MLLDPTLLSAYLVVSITLAISPGLDLTFVLASGLKHQTKGAIAATLGIAAGSLVHSIIAAVGISALISQIPNSFDIVKIAGASYLAYLGLMAINGFVKSYRRQDKIHVAQKLNSAPIDTFAIFKQGLITNILNPKMIVFFIALLPQFVNPDLGRVGLQLFLLGGIHNLIGSVFLICVGVGFGSLVKLLSNSNVSRWLNLIAGVLFILLAIRLFLY